MRIIAAFYNKTHFCGMNITFCFTKALSQACTCHVDSQRNFVGFSCKILKCKQATSTMHVVSELTNEEKG